MAADPWKSTSGIFGTANDEMSPARKAKLAKERAAKAAKAADDAKTAAATKASAQ